MSHPDGKKIKITMDGPYEVSGGVPLNQIFITNNDQGEAASWKHGGVHSGTDDTYKLCRCGQSRDKPLCDGSHEDCFCGRENAERPVYQEHARLIEGETINLLDDESLCVGARFCDRGPGVWELVRTSGDAENRCQAIQQACDCPSGRLTVTDRDGGPIEPDLPREISLIEDPTSACRGPLWVKGGIEIEGANGERYEVRNRVTLCRCGSSQNQPFCDGTHYDCDCMKGLDPDRT